MCGCGSVESRFIDLAPSPNSWDKKADGIKEMQSAEGVEVDLATFRAGSAKSERTADYRTNEAAGEITPKKGSSAR